VTPEPTVSTLVVRALIHAAEAAGASRAALLQVVGMSTHQLDQTDARVVQSEIFRICELLLEHSGDPALGLRWTASLRERSFGPVTHLLAYSQNLREGLELLAQFEPLLFEGQSAYAFIENTHCFTLRRVGYRGTSARCAMFTAELIISGFLLLVQTYFAGACAMRVAFEHAAPGHAAEYERTFGPVVQFEQPYSEIEFESNLLDARSPHADPEMYGAQKAIAERRMLQVTQRAPYAVRLRELLRERMPARISMASAARTLGLSERSLRNELTSEGTSYREVEYTALGAVAKQLLQDPQRTIQQTAYEMGFSDATTFHRAFKRWTGMTPSAARERSPSE
jgi:AraC-like DNA-binding protein